MEFARANEVVGSGGGSGQAKNEIGRKGARFGTHIAIDIETKPNEAPDAAEANLFGSQAGSIAGGNASHFGEIVHGPEFDIMKTRHLPHGIELAGDALPSCYAGLGAAIKNFFDGI